MASSSAAALMTTKGSTGVISWFKRQTRLGFRENKDVVFKAQVVRGPVVKGDDLSKDALFQAILYYCANGHPVEIPGLGSIGVNIRTKVAKSEKDLSADNIMQKYLRWYPKKEIRVAGTLANLKFVENKELSKLAIAAGPDWKDPNPIPGA